MSSSMSLSNARSKMSPTLASAATKQNQASPELADSSAHSSTLSGGLTSRDATGMQTSASFGGLNGIMSTMGNIMAKLDGNPVQRGGAKPADTETR